MKELKLEELNKVSGGVIHIPAARAAALATIAEYDASMQAGKGFEKGFESKKAEMKKENGWD